MSFMGAALLAAWIVLVLLAFALAGLLHQQRDLQAAVTRLGAGPGQRRPVPASLRSVREGSTLAVLLVDHRCTTCPEVLVEFLRLVPELPDDVEAVVLTHSAGGTGAAGLWAEVEQHPQVRLVIDTSAYHLLDPGWRPALLHIDHAGAVVREVPAGSPDALAAALSGNALPGQTPEPPTTRSVEPERKT